jgi:hypothetical protein
MTELFHVSSIRYMQDQGIVLGTAFGFKNLGNRGFVQAVSTQTVEDSLEGTLLGHRDLLTHGQREEGHIVLDTHGELVAGLLGLEVLEDCQHLCGSSIL